MRNWRRLLVLYAAKVLGDVGAHSDAAILRAIARRVPFADGGGFRIQKMGEPVPGRIYQALPEEIDLRGPAEIAFIAQLDIVPEERIYRRPVLPEWAEE